MDFKSIIEARIPTDEQMAGIAQEWWSHHNGVSFLDWNDTLFEHSYPVVMVAMPNDLIQKTLALLEPSEPLHGPIENLVSEYRGLIEMETFPRGWHDSFFIKLISRSPKDYLDDFELKSVEQAVEAIANSMRCFEDLCMFRYLDCAHLVIRPFVKFEKWQEWRVLVSEGKIAGISQYFYMENFGFSPEQATEIEREIREFVDGIVTPNMSVESFVADIIVSDGDSPTVLLETNPYGLSDPCLFKEYSALDGSFRYVK